MGFNTCDETAFLCPDEEEGAPAARRRRRGQHAVLVPLRQRQLKEENVGCAASHVTWSSLASELTLCRVLFSEPLTGRTFSWEENQTGRFGSCRYKKNTKKNRMRTLFIAVTEARDPPTGRRLCDLFMVKPSKKDYPDYYKVGLGIPRGLSARYVVRLDSENVAILHELRLFQNDVILV